MKSPNPNNTWETFIPIPTDCEGNNYYKYLDLLRFKVSPLIRNLEARDLIDWYCFLIHSAKTSGLTQDQGQSNVIYVHIRLSFKCNIKDEEIEEDLPEYCTIPLTANKRIIKTDVIGRKIELARDLGIR